MLTNCNYNVGDFGRLLLRTGAQQWDLHRRFIEMEKANMKLLDMYSGTLEKHEALTRHIQQQYPKVWNTLKDISGRLDSILVLIDGSHPSAHASQLTQP